MTLMLLMYRTLKYTISELTMVEAKTILLCYCLLDVFKKGFKNEIIFRLKIWKPYTSKLKPLNIQFLNYFTGLPVPDGHSWHISFIKIINQQNILNKWLVQISCALNDCTVLFLKSLNFLVNKYYKILSPDNQHCEK